MRLTKGEIAGFCLVLVTAVACIVAGCVASARTDLHSTWPESAEFAQLATGQERFSEHGTNLDHWYVIVDHETGAQYLYRYEYGVTPLLDADGTPLLAQDAGE